MGYPAATRRLIFSHIMRALAAVRQAASEPVKRAGDRAASFKRESFWCAVFLWNSEQDEVFNDFFRSRQLPILVEVLTELCVNNRVQPLLLTPFRKVRD
jgi:hypothetical protein